MSMLPSKAPTTFNLLAKPTGAVCNLACGYCYYLSKELLYPGGCFRMSDQVLNAYIQQLLASQPGPEVSISWQGGEPMLMGLEFFKRSINLVEKYKKPGQRVTFSLQTNGTRLDTEWCIFFKEHSFLIGLSLDGPRDLHNTYRVDKGGMGSFDQAKRGWDLLQKYQVDTNILCAVHDGNASHPLDVYRFFRDGLQARFIQFIPVVERLAPEHVSGAEKRSLKQAAGERPMYLQQGTPVSQRSVKSEQYGAFLCDIFEEWVRQDVGTVFVQIFDSALASWCRLSPNICVFQETCGQALVLEHNGDLYSCDHFVEPGYRLGNILETPMVELVTSSQQNQFGMDKGDRLPSCCRACDVIFACYGECPRNRFLKTPDGLEEGLNYLCAGYRSFFHHIEQPMRTMAALLHMGRAPAEIMHRKDIKPVRAKSH